MSKLYRPSIPLSVKCAVAEQQILLLTPDTIFDGGVPEKPLARRLEVLKEWLAEQLGCEVDELRLDHDPPLGARPKHRRGLGKKTYYVPDANDPAHLFYRPHGPEHDGSHLIKTNVRGDHGQHPDRVLIKKARRAEASRNGETRRRSSGFPKPAARLKRAPDSRVKPRLPKWKWPKRKFQSRRRKP